MTTKEMIEVLEAHEAGKSIERKGRIYDLRWREYKHTLFNFDQYVYRIKRDPLQEALDLIDTLSGRVPDLADKSIIERLDAIHNLLMEAKQCNS